jgi:hypothetical protein
LIIEGASSQDDNAEVFDNFDCPECNVVTQLCEETKRALISYYQENILKKIEEKQNELNNEERQVKSAERSRRDKSQVSASLCMLDYDFSKKLGIILRKQVLQKNPKAKCVKKKTGSP